MVLQGVVSVDQESFGFMGAQALGSVAVSSFEVSSRMSRAEPIVGEVAAGGDCDKCHFVVIVAGRANHRPDYWNDVVQKYDYKTGTLNVCPDTTRPSSKSRSTSIRTRSTPTTPTPTSTA